MAKGDVIPNVAMQYETKEISQTAKERVTVLIQQVQAAETLRNHYIQGLGDALGLGEGWTFEWKSLSFVRPKKDDKCLDTEKLPLTGVSPTSKT